MKTGIEGHFKKQGENIVFLYSDSDPEDSIDICMSIPLEEYEKAREELSAEGSCNIKTENGTLRIKRDRESFLEYSNGMKSYLVYFTCLGSEILTRRLESVVC